MLVVVWVVMVSPESNSHPACAVTSFVVQVMPREMEHREFRYSFKVITVREINAFALPGGPCTSTAP